LEEGSCGRGALEGFAGIFPLENSAQNSRLELEYFNVFFV
jgi:hypothetical protein